MFRGLHLVPRLILAAAQKRAFDFFPHSNMNNPSTIPHRIEVALDEAQGAFWETIANHFSEATTGDLTPEMTNLFTSQAFAAVTEWVEANANLADRDD